MAKIIAPNKEYNGVSAGVMFTDGIGHTNNRSLMNWFRTHGYIVQYAEKEPVKACEWTSDEVAPKKKPEPRKRTRKKGA